MLKPGRISPIKKFARKKFVTLTHNIRYVRSIYGGLFYSQYYRKLNA